MQNNYLEREIEFHNSRFGEEIDPREGLGKWYSAVQHCSKQFYDIVRETSKDKIVLDYGCGIGGNALDIIPTHKYSKTFTGIDISDVAISKANTEMQRIGVTNGQFFAMNAEATTFANASFDVVYGTAILHHLDIKKSFTEIHRILKSNGIAIFTEPLGHNPLINRFRNNTPDLRTSDEHPLRMSDFKIAKSIFSKVEIKYFGLATLGAATLHNTILFNPLYKFSILIDKVILAIPIIQKNAWMSLIILKK